MSPCESPMRTVVASCARCGAGNRVMSRADKMTPLIARRSECNACWRPMDVWVHPEAATSACVRCVGTGIEGGASVGPLTACWACEGTGAAWRRHSCAS